MEYRWIDIYIYNTLDSSSYLGFDFFPDFLAADEHNARPEHKHDVLQLQSFLDLAEAVTQITPLHRTIHLQLTHTQVHRLSMTSNHCIKSQYHQYYTAQTDRVQTQFITQHKVNTCLLLEQHQQNLQRATCKLFTVDS